MLRSSWVCRAKREFSRFCPPLFVSKQINNNNTQDDASKRPSFNEITERLQNEVREEVIQRSEPQLTRNSNNAAKNDNDYEDNYDNEDEGEIDLEELVETTSIKAMKAKMEMANEEFAMEKEHYSQRIRELEEELMKSKKMDANWGEEATRVSESTKAKRETMKSAENDALRACLEMKLPFNNENTINIKKVKMGSPDTVGESTMDKISGLASPGTRSSGTQNNDRGNLRLR